MRRVIATALLLVSQLAHAGEGSIAGRVATHGKGDTVVVYIENVPNYTPKAPAAAPTVAQKSMRFVPAVSVVVAGGNVEFPNEDKVFHNVFSPSKGNEFDLGLYRAGGSKAAKLSEPGEVDVYCNIHPQMEAKILVVQNEYFGRADGLGTYSIAHVPAGTYQLVAWSAWLVGLL
jgi:plastocyanin